MTKTEPTTEEALWQAVGANPADSLPRLVLADYLEENAGSVACPLCNGEEEFGRPCKVCRTTGRISDGRSETAAALRATEDRVPYPKNPGPHREYWWCYSDDDSYNPVNKVPISVFRCLTGAITYEEMRDYPTALAAIKDLCAAWVKVHTKSEVQS